MSAVDGRRRGLRRKLIIYFTIAGALPLILGLAATFLTSRTALRSSVGTTLAQAAILSAHRLEEQAALHSERLAGALRRPDILEALRGGAPQPLDLGSDLIVVGLPVIRACVTDGWGRVVAAHGLDDPRRAAALCALSDLPQLGWSESDGRAVLRVREAVTDFDGRRRGRVVAELDARPLLGAVGDASEVPHRRIWHIDAAGRVLGGRRPGTQLDPRMASLLERESVGFDIIEREGGAGGNQRLVGFAPANVSGAATPLLVVVESDLEHALESSRLLATLIVTLAVVLTILLVWSGGFWSARILAPIHEIGAAVRAVTHGDLGRRVHIATGDELEELAQGYNEMIEGLVRYHSLLEERIERGEEEIESKRRELAATTEERELSSAELGLLYAVARSVLRSTDLGATLRGLVDTSRIVFGAARAYVLLRVAEGLEGAAVSPDWGAKGAAPFVAFDSRSAALEAYQRKRAVTVENAAENPYSEGPDPYPEHAAIYVPILGGAETIGVLALIAAQPVRSWDERTLGRARRVADQAAVAITNARLVSDLGERVQDLSALYELGRAVVSNLDLERLLSGVLEILEERFHYAQSAIVLPAAGGGDLFCAAQRGFPRARADDILIPAGAGICGEVMATCKPVQVPDARSDPRFVFGIEGSRSTVAVTLRKGDRVIGVLDIESSEVGAFGERDVQVLTLLAPLLAIAIENARIHGSTHASERRFRALFDVGRALVSTYDLKDLMDRALTILDESLGYHNAAILLYDRERRALTVEAFRGHSGEGVVRVPLGSGVCGHVGLTREPLIVPDVREEPRCQTGWPGARAELAVPIVHGEELLGVLDIESERKGVLSPADRDILTLFAAQMAAAIKNARLFHERELALEESQEADRLKTEFLANTSHELRTPLTAIIGFSEVLADGLAGDLNEAQARCVNDVLTSGRHLLNLINQLLDLSRIESGKMEPSPAEIEVEELFQEVETTISGLASKKRLELLTEISGGGERVYTDRGMLKQVLLNLVGNAAKFTPDRGRITLSAVAADADCAERHAARGGQLPPEALILISVADTGIGIAKADQSVIFNEFRQADGSYTREHQGSGLGLTLSKRFIELNQGVIWVDSEIGKGATFKLVLPCIAPSALEGSIRAEEAPRPILLVEDDLNSLKLLRRLVEGAGYEVLTATTGEKALALARRSRPRVIVLDVMLPDMDGWSIMEQLKAEPKTERIPVIITSVLGNPGLGIGLGASDYFTKPVPREQFLARIAKLGEWRRTRIQVISDDAEIRGRIVTALDRPGWDVRTQVSDEQPLGGGCDLVVLDIGTNQTRRVVPSREQLPIPLILVSRRKVPPQERRGFPPTVEGLVAADPQLEENLAELIDRLDQRRNRAIGG